MTAILIFEGNTPASVAAGHSGAAGFVRSIAGLSPTVECRIVQPHAGSLPGAVFASVDGVIFSGSREPWAANAPEAAPQRAAMQAAFDAGLPVWGSCNGLHLAAVILGGAVGAAPRGIEVGVARNTRITDAGRTHAIMAGRSNGFAVPCIHRDEVQRLPSGAVLIAENDHSPVQAMVCTTGGVDFWGTQYHPELTPHDIADYVRADGIFETLADMATALDAAETDEAAADRLGISMHDLALETRARELANWLAHVESRTAAA